MAAPFLAEIRTLQRIPPSASLLCRPQVPLEFSTPSQLAEGVFLRGLLSTAGFWSVTFLASATPTGPHKLVAKVYNPFVDASRDEIYIRAGKEILALQALHTRPPLDNLFPTLRAKYLSCDGFPIIVVDYAGMPLSQRRVVPAAEAIPRAVLRDVTTALLDALKALQLAGLEHCDVCLDNVCFQPHGGSVALKLIDFNSCKQLHPPPHRSVDAPAIGRILLYLLDPNLFADFFPSTNMCTDQELRVVAVALRNRLAAPWGPVLARLFDVSEPFTPAVLDALREMIAPVAVASAASAERARVASDAEASECRLL
jgi:hypothetical protein